MIWRLSLYSEMDASFVWTINAPALRRFRQIYVISVGSNSWSSVWFVQGSLATFPRLGLPLHSTIRHSESSCVYNWSIKWLSPTHQVINSHSPAQPVRDTWSLDSLSLSLCLHQWRCRVLVWTMWIVCGCMCVISEREREKGRAWYYWNDGRFVWGV